MVSVTSIIFMVITAIVTLFGPIVAAIVFYRKNKYPLVALFIGMGVFFVFQIVIRIPILQLVLPNFDWYKNMTSHMVIYAVFLGFTAGLVEEAGRFLAYKTILKKHMNWESAIAFGIGHGGIESILLIGLSFVSNLVMSMMINSGVFDSAIAPTLPAGTADLLKNALVGTDSYMFLIGGLERILTFIIHIGFSVMIMVGIRKGKGLLYVCIAILIHMVLDTSAVLMSQNGVPVMITEVYLAIYAVVAIVYVFKASKWTKINQNLQNEQNDLIIDN